MFRLMGKEESDMKNFIVKNGPGFLVCLVIAAIAQGIARLAPAVGAALFAIGLGIVCGNTFLNKPCFDAGTKFSERNLLEYSIVLTGATLLLGDILALGLPGLGFGKKFSLLMGAGNAVCGSSAIATVSPVIKAESKDKGISITVVNVTGTFMILALPLITGLVYGHESLRSSAMIGGITQSIGQVIAAAQLVGGEVVQTATIFKIIRIVFIVLVALAFSRMSVEKNDGPLFERGAGAAAGKVKAGVPWIIVGVFIFAAANTLHLVPAPVGAAAKAVSQQFEIIALAAIGMRVKFRDLAAEGPKALLYGLSVGGCQILFALALIALFW